MLATLSGLKLRLGLAVATDDLFLTRELVAADAAAKRYCRRDLEAADYEEFFDGCCRELVLGQYPATLFTGTSADDPDFDYGVWIDGQRLWPASSLLTLGTDYRLQKAGSAGIIRMVRGRALGGGLGWSGASGWAGEDSVRVHYRAGYEEDAIPPDLTEAVEKLAALEYLSRATGGAGGAAVVGQVKMERLGQYQVAYMTPSEMVTSSSTSANTPKEIMDVRSLLDQFRAPQTWGAC